ncbi:MAG TPA: DUF1428 domain-containing protein [Candidatus Peribacteria bacterium]|nr:DUF1428 domain-containing protein [Candidatus Peribacteria bacterium]
MAYVDGYVLVLPKKNLKSYKKMAALGAKVWRKHGAIQYVETVAEDLTAEGLLSYKKLLKLKPGETVVYSWIMFKSRAHRDRVNAKVMKDPAMMMAGMSQATMPFEFKRMAYGGFATLVQA